MTQRYQHPNWPADHRWPVAIGYGDVWLAPFTVADTAEWAALRSANLGWLAPWEATAPQPQSYGTPRQRIRAMGRTARAGQSLPWLIRLGSGRRPTLVGQCTVANIVYGSACYASIGYWIARDFAGRGIVPRAVAMATDYAMKVVGLHRIEVCIRPENAASLRVVAKLGFREEGLRPRFLHIAGRWCDHRVFALTREDIPDGLLPRLAGLPPVSAGTVVPCV